MLSTKEQMLLAKRLGFLLKAGVPLLESLTLVKKQAVAKKTNTLITEVIKEISNGAFLSTTLKNNPGIFSQFGINIIQSGEQNGLLAANLEYLSTELQKRSELNRTIIGALFYPCVIAVASLGMATVLTTMVFPKVVPMFTSMNVELPVTTKILMIISSTLLHHPVMVITVSISLVVIVWQILRIEKVKHWTEKILLTIPVTGGIIRAYILANFSRTLGLLLKGDLPLDKALSATIQTTSNSVYKFQIEQMQVRAIQGGRISEVMEQNAKLFPVVISHMIAIGETSGTAAESLLYIADMYEQEVKDAAKNLTSLLEPVLMIGMGIMVGFIAIAMITPMYAITEKLHP